MGLPIQKQFEVGQEPLTDRISRPSADYTVPTNIFAVYASTTSSGSAFTITLGPPEANAGQVKAIFMEARDGTKNITVSGEGFTDIVLDAANEYTILYSTGLDWLEIGANHA